MFVYIFVNFIIVYVIIQFAACNEDVVHYLTKRTDFVRDSLRGPTQIFGNGVTMEFYDTRPLLLQKHYKNGIIFSLFNVTHILMDTDIYVLNENYQAQPSKTLDEAIVFIKTIEYKDFVIAIFVSSNGLLKVYGKQENETDLSFFHSIATRSCSDINLFSQNGDVYMIVASGAGLDVGPSACDGTCVFHWTGVHFDKVHEIVNVKTVGLASFPSSDSRIIVALRKTNPTYVYSFDGKKLRTIQSLKTENPTQVISYKLEKRDYIVILDGPLYRTYFWNGVEFFHIKSSHCLDIDKIYPHTINDEPLFFASKQSKLVIYKPTPTGGILQSVTFNVQENYTNISTIEPIFQKDDYALFVLYTNSSIPATVLPFTLHFNSTIEDEQEEESGDNLLRCMKDLGNILEDYETETVNVKKKMEKYVREQVRNDTGAANTKGDIVGSPFFEERENMLKDLHDYLQELRMNKVAIQRRIQDLNNEPFFVNATITGNLIAETLRATSLQDVKDLNNVTWNPASWLTYNDHQNVTGPAVTTTVVVTNLWTSANDALFKNLLLRSGSQILSGSNKFESLTASKINCDNINGIPFENIYLKTQNQEILGTKIFDSLEAKNVTVDILNKKAPYEILNALSDPKLYHFKFGPRLNVENLDVKEINGVEWYEFSKSVFRSGISSKITGNLRLDQFSVDRLKAKTINSILINDLFTTTTDQTVKSIIHFQSIDVGKNIDSQNINGLDLRKEAVVFSPTNITVVQGPISIRNLKAYGELYINSSKPVFSSNLTENILQIYHEKVKITGNVVVNNIFLDSIAKLTVNGRPFQTSMLQNYWLKNDFQIIPVHTTFPNGASIPHLVTKSLNGINISDYMVQNVDNDKSGRFYFENVTVLGDVHLDQKKQHQPDLKAIDADSVKYFGRYKMKGKTRFEGVVTVKNLKVSLLDNIDSNKAVTKDANVKITGRKNFDTLVVTENVKANSSVLIAINNLNLKLLQAEALYVDEETLLTLPHVNLNELNVQNLRVTYLNGKPMNDYVIKKNRKQPNNTIASLRLHGNVTINKAKLGNMNGIPVEQLLARVLNDSIMVTHDVYFPGSIQVKNLEVTKINGVIITRLAKRLLYRNHEQTVIAPFTFDDIKLDNLYTEKINNISLVHLIDTEKNASLTINKNVTLNNVAYIKNLKANSMLCNIKKAVHLLENPTKPNWKSVEILGALTIANKNSELLNILQNLVTTNSNNVITAPVTFEGHIFANTITTTGNMSGVNISHIAHDAIYSTVKGKPITVTGSNVFHSVKAAEVVVQGNAIIPRINRISVLKINSSVIHKNTGDEYYVKGKKTFFGGMQTKFLHTNIISGVKPENLVNLKDLKVIPKATFDRLVVSENLDIGKVNTVGLDWFLGNRVLCKSDALQTLQGTYHFEKMIFNNAVVTPHLNHLLTEDIVTDDDLQNIQSEKIFLTDVSTSGNINIGLINGVDLKKFYRASIFTERDEQINGNLTIQSNSTWLSNINVETLNGIPIERLKYIIDFHDPEIVAKSAGNTLQTIGDVVKKSLNNLKFLPDKLMYIQEVTTLRAAMPPSQDTRVIQLTENSSLVLLDGQVSGVFCGLLPDCPCPIEYTVYFGPGKITIHNNTHHRVYKYNEKDTFVSISTTSRSVSSYCRTNASKEITQLSWRNTRTNITGLRKIPGYLSDAEFFTYDGRVYVIYCEYYNKIFDSHEWFCTVMRTKRNGEMEEIQNIPVKGAWKTHILYTAQGVVLIIGNVVPGLSNHTDIYRFNAEKLKFEYLRGVKTIGCTAAAGVVLETESLIILAQPETPVQILKYDSSFDNYYFYQSFSMDYPVTSVSVFYTGGFGISDAYLCAIMSNGDFNIYSFKEIEGWKLEISGSLQGLADLIPIEMNKTSYLFAPSSAYTKLLAIVRHSDA